MSTDKRSCMVRAKQLLETAQPHAIRYAALELRMCMEALTYEKLRAFSSMIPESVLTTWQPPQAVKTLLQFEPHADQSFFLEAGIEEQYGQPAKHMHYIGTHNAIGYKWLRKHYHKLGSLLHAPVANSGLVANTLEQVVYLNEVIAELDKAIAGNILGGSIREVFQFECTVCNQLIVSNAKTTTKSRQVVCLNPQCGAEYFASIAFDGLLSVQLKVSEFDCINCKELIPIENRRLNIGVKFECSSCGQCHVIVNRTWHYGAEKS